MHIVGETLVAAGILEMNFQCDLKICKGRCCIVGELGPRIAQQEIDAVSAILPEVLELLPTAQVTFIDRHGFVTGNEETRVALLGTGGPCVFTCRQDNVILCALQVLQERLALPPLKPLSCDLFPIRMKTSGSTSYLTFVTQQECRGCFKGNRPMYESLAAPLRRAMGDKWFEHLRREADTAPQR
ncbi:DUF3109 family protein [bacterium]|nr:DUF3109 family protein [candidate division CSSED10-310 bacterium]